MEALLGLRHLQASSLHPWANHGLGFGGGGRWRVVLGDGLELSPLIVDFVGALKGSSW